MNVIKRSGEEVVFDASKIENAIKKGLKNPEDYMYVYTLNQKDYFKNRDILNPYETLVKKS